MDPYAVLGVSRDATEDEIKKAYRKKARENHPDLNPGDEAAAERMNQVNEAYDRITNPEKYAASDARKRGYGAPYAPGYAGYGSPYGGSPFGGYPGGAQQPGAGQGSYGGGPYQYQWVEVDWDDIFGSAWGGAQQIHPEPAATDSAEVRQAIAYINMASFTAALGILDNIAPAGRDARWSYLSAIAHHGKGHVAQAQARIRAARREDPGNADYAYAESVINQPAVAYQQEGAGRGFSTSCINPAWPCCCFCMAPGFCPAFCCL